MPSSPNAPNPVIAAWRDGFQRVRRAPAVLVSVFIITLLAALPLAITMRGLIDTSLGRSLRSEQVADGADPDWLQEFAFQASGIGTTLTPSVIGFATTLDSISSVADGRGPQVEV